MKRILIDTNIYSHAMLGEERVVETLRHVDEIGISSISIGELISGFKGGNREAINRMELNHFLDSPRVTLCRIDVETAEFYAAVLQNLKKAGTPIPTNDIWIAACCFQKGMHLYTMDRHFDDVHGLVLV